MTATPQISERRMIEMTDSGLWPNRSVIDVYNDAVRLKKNDICVVDYQTELETSHELTYGEVDQLATRLACGFYDLGVRKGEVVSFQMPNWWQFVVIHFACLKIGAISNPLMPIFRQRELSYMMEFAESKIMIIPKKFRGFDYEEMIEELRPQLPKLEHVLTIAGSTSGSASNSDDGSVGSTTSREGAMSFERFMLDNEWEKKHDPKVIFEEQKLEPNDVLLIMYTSGTTGMPKGVMHTSNTFLFGLKAVAEWLKIEEGAVGFMGSPLAHLTGFLYGMWWPIYLKSKMVLLDVWNADIAWRLIDEHNAFFTMGATPFLADMTRSPEAARQVGHKTLSHFLCGGAPIPRALAREAVEKLNIHLAPLWGMTETGIITTVRPGSSPERATETDGNVIDHCGAKIVDPVSREDLANGQDGLLLARSPSNFVGYLKSPEAYDTDVDGWFNTGDIARMDDAGYIRITGRAKDIIIRGGENIPVVEVENILYRHPNIEDAAVVGMPHPRLGELGCCFLTLKDGDAMSFEELQVFMDAEGLAKQYWPEHVEIITEFPRTASGKIQKFKLREMAQKIDE